MDVPSSTPAKPSIKVWQIVIGSVVAGGLFWFISGSSLSERSTCHQFQNASAAAQDKALAAMANAHHEDMGMTRLSLGMYCQLYPNRPINGIYNGN